MISARQILIGIVLTIVSLSTLLAQPQELPVNPTISVLEQTIKISDGTTYYNWTGYVRYIGRYDDATYYNRFRTAWVFNFGQIPSDARINSVTLILTINNWSSSSSTAKIIKLPASLYNDATTWNAFTGSQTTYFSGLKYQDMTAKSLTSSTLTTDVANAVKNNPILTIGIMSENEGTNLTDAAVTVNIKVNYTPKVTVIVQNSFSGGQIDVDGTNRNSGWSSTSPQWYSGDSHTLRAYSQTVGGVTYPFPAPGTWTNVTTGATKSQTNNNTPISITPTSNCTWRANFGTGTASVTVKNSFNGGLVKVEGTNVASGTSFPWLIGSSHTLEAFNQNYQASGEANYYRVYQDWSRPSQQNTTTNPLAATITSAGNFIANFKKQFNITLNKQTDLDGTISALYTTVIEPNSVSVTAPQTFTVNSHQYIFARWSDGTTANPKTITPTDHTILTAIYETNTVSGTLQQNTTWSIAKTLAGNVYVPSGIELTIAGATVNLNGYSIFSTGGTITNNGTITGLRAYLENGSTTKGYCGSINTACNNASTNDLVDIQSGTFSENISFTGKNNLTIAGQGVNQTNLLGSTLSVYSSASLFLRDFTCLSVYINNSTSPILHIKAINTSGSYSAGLGIYNSGGYFSGTIQGHYNGYQASLSTHNVYCYDNSSNTNINNNYIAVSATNNSNFLLYKNFPAYINICGNSSYEFTANSGAHISAMSCSFPNGSPRIYQNGGTVTIISPLTCSGLSKTSYDEGITNQDVV